MSAMSRGRRGVPGDRKELALLVLPPADVPVVLAQHEYAASGPGRAGDPRAMFAVPLRMEQKLGRLELSAATWSTYVNGQSSASWG